MIYFKNTENGYILSISTNCGQKEITKEEYNSIVEILKNKPTPIEGYDYNLKEDLTWELYEVKDVEEEPTDDEYIECAKILMGVTD